jgi:hypothetical protein
MTGFFLNLTSLLCELVSVLKLKPWLAPDRFEVKPWLAPDRLDYKFTPFLKGNIVIFPIN